MPEETTPLEIAAQADAADLGIITIDANASYKKAVLAERLGLSGKTIERQAKRRKFPRPFYIGRSPYWLGSAVLTWIENRQRDALVR